MMEFLYNRYTEHEKKGDKMNEWKELKIDNLPSDILVEGKYEIADYDSYQGIYVPTTLHPVDCLSNIITSKRDYTYFYRTPEPLPPTHEARMSLYFLNDNGIWESVTAYCPLDPLRGNMKAKYHVLAAWVSEAWFIGRESAVIPPEAI